jgi:lysophospholipase L1-like esterase
MPLQFDPILNSPRLADFLSELNRYGAPRNVWLPFGGYTFSDQAGTTPITSGTAIEYIRDYGSVAVPLVRKTGAARPTWNTSGYATSVSASNQYLGAGAVSDFKALHDGTGGTLYFIARGTSGAGQYFGTNAGAAATGMIGQVSPSGQIVYQVRNGGTLLVNITLGVTGQSNAWTIAALQFNSSQYWIWQDGCNRRNPANVVTPNTGNSGSFFNLGYSAAVPASDADFGGAIIYSTVHTPAQVRQVMRILSEYTAAQIPTNHVAFLGDSTMLGAAPVATPFPTLTITLKGSRHWRGVNLSVSGARSDQINSAQYTGDGNKGQYGRFSHMVLMCGINDVGQNYPTAGTSGSTCVTNINAMVDDFLLREQKQVVLAVHPMPSNDGLTTTFDATQQAQYAVLKAGVLSKVASDPTRIKYADVYTGIGGSVGCIQPAYTYDGTHPNDAGCAIIAQLVADALTQ